MCKKRRVEPVDAFFVHSCTCHILRSVHSNIVRHMFDITVSYGILKIIKSFNCVNTSGNLLIVLF